MAKIKDICNEAAIMAGDDNMELYEPQQYLEWFQQFCLWVADLVSPDFFGDLTVESSSLTQTDGSEDVTLPTDFAKLLSATRDAVLCDIIEDPIVFQEVYVTGSPYHEPSSTDPVCTLLEGTLKAKPVGKTGNSAVILWYIKTVGDDIEVDLPISIRLRPSAVAYIAGRALSAEADAEAIEAAKAKLEEASLLAGN